MTLFHALIFGIVEGISEFLPISSTGHLILTAQILKLSQTEFLKSFEIAIQLGAICSVVLLYFKSLLVDRQTIKRIIAAFIPTGIIGFVLYKAVKHFLLGNTSVVLWAMLIGGVLLILFELTYREKENVIEKTNQISYRQAILIGIFQSIAIIPGVSRSAATILGGLLLGLKRKTIVEFSFLLAVPTMLAATVLDLVKSGNTFTADQVGVLLVGFVSSFVVAVMAIKFFISFVQKHNFIVFGIYRIIAALFFFLFK